MLVKSSRVHAVLAVSLMLCLVAPAAAGAASGAPSSFRNPISMQAQQRDQWCWAASGNTIAAYHGVTVSQTRFCQLAHNAAGADCADLPGTLADPQRAFARLGFTSPGRYFDSRITYAAIRTQTAANRPVETRVGYRSGGGHTHVLYGYDTRGDWVYWGDPGPAKRYNWSTYGYYTHNSSFSWTHTLSGVSR
ncbi:papain-like cysteine protease family protein [Amycolatopsis sp., V23-08]|uniref:Papain-like cysteine protease family protein n=1 Tax=Amycolatopsis heterodermiae TaxID=3110235 RepID=A0ABU5QX07_9PSEU|nr:papain-like cysteine protease family protein [Amycolatopsis sp., V23-08]MEA5358457.1 papain-like cysteine protease family protein [Amycolatopsis sp., V23-08]